MIVLALLVPEAAAESGATAAHHVAQARQFLKNGWLRDAAAEIEAALALPDGVTSPEAAALGAQVYFQLRDLERCLPLARRAADLAPSDVARVEADAWVAQLEQYYGFVEVRAPMEGLSTRLLLEAEGLVIDPAHRAWIDGVALTLRERTDLPVRVGLPVGAYRINGQAVSVDPASTSTLSLPMSALSARGLSALKTARLGLASGLSVPFGSDTRDMLPSPYTELSLTQPIGGTALLAATGAWEPRGHATPGGPAAGVGGWSAGLRAGAAWGVGDTLAVQTSLGIRYAEVPGVRLDCSGGAEGLDCNGGTAAVVTAHARAVVPYAEVSADWRAAGRATSSGIGVVFAVDHLRGEVPDGTARSATLTVPYTAERAWTATAVRLAMRASLAF